MRDCIIVGGGPAGLTAALYLARFLRDVVVFDARQGRAAMIPKTRNQTPFPDGISGRDLLERMRTHAQLYGAGVVCSEVREVVRHNGAFRVTTDHGGESARRIIFATGVVNHRPPLPAPDHDLGMQRGLIRYCPVCDAYEVRDQRVGVLGTGEHALAEARFIGRYSSDVTLITPGGSPHCVSGEIASLAAPMSRLSLTESQVVVELEGGGRRRFDTLYVALGTRPRSDLAARLGARLSPSDCVDIDQLQRTSVDGVYAIGDVVEGLDQIAYAMGQGAVAATEIHNTLCD